MAFEKINEFAADKQKLCVEHDTISDELFREYGVTADCATSTERAC